VIWAYSVALSDLFDLWVNVLLQDDCGRRTGCL
jgi:hypothetical protein